MISSEKFFWEHKNEIDMVCSLFADDESINVYKAMWKFRRTHDYNCLPVFDEKKQYFGYDFFIYKNGEKLIDCGAYDGDTIDSFVKCMNKKAIRDYSIIAFEPDPANCEYIEKNEKVTVIPKGVWDRKTILKFSSGKETGGKLIDEANGEMDYIEVHVSSIDEEQCCQDATMIKMDVEGAEWNALHGAEELIRKQKPKLAICIYHSDDDMIRIPIWINNLGLEYKLYVRQHSDTRHETVLYAV